MTQLPQLNARWGCAIAVAAICMTFASESESQPIDPGVVACAADVLRQSSAFEAAFKKGVADGKIDAKEKSDLDRIEAEAKALLRKAKEDSKLTMAECTSVQAKVAEGTKRLNVAIGGRPAWATACLSDISRERTSFDSAMKKGVADGRIDAKEKADLERTHAELLTLEKKALEDKSLSSSECKGIQAKIAEENKKLTAAFASGGQGAGGAKYDQVAAVMKQVFTGGDLSPNSRAVKHAADVDMPARGGNPEALKVYLNSQNGTVKNWYKTNFGVTLAEQSTPSTDGRKYEQVTTVMKQVFTGGDLSPNSRAVKHAADVDMPARGGNPEALKVYLNSQNGTVKNWYKTNFGLQ